MLDCIVALASLGPVVLGTAVASLGPVVLGTAVASLGPVALGAAVAIKPEDSAPVLFKQPRMGRWGKPFDIWKLRTISYGQVAQVGAWLRVTGMNELPQFVQVLRGAMAVVGPRPLVLADLVRLGWQDDFIRSSVWPGITGVAQIYGGCAEASLESDHWHVDRRGVATGLAVVAVSVLIATLGKNRIRTLIRRWPRASAGQTHS